MYLRNYINIAKNNSDLTHSLFSPFLVVVVVEVSAKVDVCTHPGSFGDMCILCGQRLEGETGVTLGYIHKVYIISCEWLAELQI